MRDLIPWRKKPKKTTEIVDHSLMSSHQEIESLFDRFFESGPFSVSGRNLFNSKYMLQPGIDISENKKSIMITAELPGMDSKEIDVSLDGRLLTIQGEKKSEDTVEKDHYYHTELSYGRFSRTIELPADVDESTVDASYKKGVLKIKMKKNKEAQGKKIKIKSH